MLQYETRKDFEKISMLDQSFEDRSRSTRDQIRQRLLCANAADHCTPHQSSTPISTLSDKGQSTHRTAASLIHRSFKLENKLQSPFSLGLITNTEARRHENGAPRVWHLSRYGRRHPGHLTATPKLTPRIAYPRREYCIVGLPRGSQLVLLPASSPVTSSYS
jgi:nucleotidyltransferase/DNA polymerase involved in DNA repair